MFRAVLDQTPGEWLETVITALVAAVVVSSVTVWAMWAQAMLPG